MGDQRLIHPRGLKDQQSRLTVAKAKAYLQYFVGGQMPPTFDLQSLMNEAGEFFASMHPWKWLTDHEIHLTLRGSVSVTGGAMDSTDAGGDQRYVLTASNAFDSYLRAEGDSFEVTGGTNVVKGFYRIAGISSNDHLILEDDPSTGIGNGSDITGTIHTTSIHLPRDLRELIAIHPTSGTSKTIQLTTYEELLEKRASNLAGFGGYWAAVTHSMDFASDGLPGASSTPVSVSPHTDTVQATGPGPKARLEITPQPAANEKDAYMLYYRAGWTHLDHDDDKLRMPSYCESLYLEILKSFALSRFGDADISSMLSNVMAGPLFLTAMDRDGSIQPHYGPIRNGAAQHVVYTSGFENYDSVAAPS